MKSRLLLIILLLNLFLQIIGNNLFAQSGYQVPELANFDTAMNSLLKQYNVPGGELAITYQGRLIYSRGFGFADTAKKAFVQPSNIFRIASLSKPITAITIMHLVEKGLLTLEDTVFGIHGILKDTMYKKILDPRVYTITIRNLLNHSGGWNPNITSDPMFNAYAIAKTMKKNPPADAKTVIEYVLSRQMLTFAPGTQYQYSNFGYCILGRVIEKVTGQQYDTYVRKAVLLPMNIKHMYIGYNLLKNKLPKEVNYYDYPNAPMALSVYDNVSLVPWPNGGFNIEAMDAHGAWVASAEELCRLLIAIDGFSSKPDFLLPTSIAAMTLPSSTNQNYALGWSVNTNNNWWHTGSLPGTTTEIVRGNNQLNWAILLNTRPSNSNALMSAVDNLVWKVIPTIKSWPKYNLFKCTIRFERRLLGKYITEIP